MARLRALGLNCTLKTGDTPSSTEILVTQVLDALVKEGVTTNGPVRVADLDIKPGVRSDEGDGDEWPGLRRRILDADILVFGTPIWLGQPSSIAKRVTERMDAFLSETDDAGRMPSFGRVAVRRPRPHRLANDRATAIASGNDAEVAGDAVGHLPDQAASRGRSSRS